MSRMSDWTSTGAAERAATSPARSSTMRRLRQLAAFQTGSPGRRGCADLAADLATDLATDLAAFLAADVALRTGRAPLRSAAAQTTMPASEARSRSWIGASTASSAGTARVR